MIDKLIGKMRQKECLSESEIDFCVDEMRRLHELDIAKWGKGSIPAEESEMREIWGASQCNIKNVIAIHKLAEDFLLNTMSDFNSNEKFGPDEDPIRALHRKEDEAQRIEDQKLRNHNHD
jgi:hypothetical protein